MSNYSSSYLILQMMGFLVMAAILSYMFKIAGKAAENLYRLEHSVPHSEEEKTLIIGRKEKHLRIFLGIGFWLMSGMAGIYAFLLIRRTLL